MTTKPLPRVSISPLPRASIYSKTPRKSTFTTSKSSHKPQAKLNPIRIFVSNDKYYNYALERISYPNSGNYILTNSIQEAPSLKAKKRESIIKEPLVLSYQKINMISYKIAHTAFIVGENLNSDHICNIDKENMRCSVCGCSLNWMFTVDNFVMKQPLRIDYFDYESIFFNENFDNDRFISFKGIRNLAILRKFFSYIAERAAGVGFYELYEKFKLINLFPIQVYKELGISYRELIEKTNEDFRIFADFEAANLQAYEYFFTKDDICKIRLLMRGDTNVLEIDKTLWFYFKVLVRKSMKIEFEILNYKENCEEKARIFVCDEKFVESDENYFPGKARWRVLKEEVFYQINDFRTVRYRSITIDEKPQENTKEITNETINNEITKEMTKEITNEITKEITNEITKEITNEFTQKNTKEFTKEITNEITKDSKEIVKENTKEISKETQIKKKFCSLKFSYFFEKASKNFPEEVLFSYGIPYTYSDLLNFLNKQEKKLFAKAMQEQDFNLKTKRILLRNELILYERSIIAETRCGTPIFLLKISSSISADETDKNEYFPINSKKKKKSIVFFARQHPYETASSFIIEGVITNLLSDSKKINLLRAFFNIYIIPMVNVDGVMIGNSVTGVAGDNFNRMWVQPNEEINLEVFRIKEYMRKLQSSNNEILMFFDVHATEKKHGVFFYSNSPSLDSKNCVLNEENIEKYMNELGKVLVFPKIFKENSKFFNEKECRYRIKDKNRENTARKVFYEELKIKQCFTVESSLFEYIDKDLGKKEMKIEDFRNVGKDLVNSLFDFSLILAEEWVRNERKIEKTMEKNKEIVVNSFARGRSPKKNTGKGVKTAKLEEKESYFYNNLKKIRAEFTVKNGWKGYFNEKELDFLKKKTKKKLFPLEILTPIEKNPQNSVKNSNKKQEENDFEQEFHQNFLLMSEIRENNEDAMSNSIDLLGNLSINSLNSNEKTCENQINQMKNKQMLKFFKETSKNESFIVKKPNLLNNSSIMVNSTSNTLNYSKKDNNSNSKLFDKSMSYRNFPIIKLLEKKDKNKFCKSKSSLNLMKNNNELALETPVFNDKSNLYNINKSSVFGRSELTRKIKEKVQGKNGFSLKELKKVKIPLRKNSRNEEINGKFEEKREENRIKDKRYQWRLKRPCSQGVIPMNPFVKQKKELMNMYSFHYKSQSLDNGSRNRNEDQGNKGNNDQKNMKIECMEPWVYKKTDTFHE